MTWHASVIGYQSSEGLRQVKLQTRASSDRAGDERNAPLIAHVFPSFSVGGAQVRFAALANHFGRAFRHIVVSLDGNLACRERLRPDLDVTFPAVPAPKNAMFANALCFRRYLRAWRPDVLVTCNWGAIEFAMGNIPAITRHIHVVDGFGPEERSTQISRRVWTRRLVLAGDTVVLPSRALVRVATDVWKLNPRRVAYVPNGIDLARFAPPASPPTRPDGTLVIGTVAALRAEKNIGRLIRAFALLAADRPAHLVIVGDGEERPALSALVQTLGLADRVTFTGHRDDTPALYAGFDVFALSSDTEQMPLSVIEAMASGLPVAATGVGDVRDMVATENAGFVTALTDEALAAALTELAGDAALRHRLGQANLTKATRDFGQDAMFAAWHALWSGAARPA